MNRLRNSETLMLAEVLASRLMQRVLTDLGIKAADAVRAITSLVRAFLPPR